MKRSGFEKIRSTPGTFQQVRQSPFRWWTIRAFSLAVRWQ